MISLYPEEIRELAMKYSDRMIRIRRHLHRNPEIDFNVKDTARYIGQILSGLGIDSHITPCNGVEALLECENEGPVIAFRADMDALPIHEQNELDYCSQNKGIMHACGHDAHMAILLGLAHILSSVRKKARGSARLIFQPAEETSGGAGKMIKNGVLETPHVKSVFSLHVSPDLPSGTVGLKEGKMRAAADMFDIRIQGVSSHGAEPDRGIDAIVVANRIISIVQDMVSRKVSPLDSAVITIGTISGGRARNILADEVSMSGIIRTLDSSTRRMIREELERIVTLTGLAMGAEATVDLFEGYPELINDPAMTGIAREAAVEYLGEGMVTGLEKPSMGVDDFSCFLKERPGCYFMLGTALRDRENYPLHHPRFNIDESVLPVAAGILAGIYLKATEMD